MSGSVTSNKANNNINKNINKQDALSAMRTPPSATEAEQSIIGALMLDNEAWDKVCSKVSHKDFYRKPHRVIFKLIQKLAEKSNGTVCIDI